MQARSKGPDGAPLKPSDAAERVRSLAARIEALGPARGPPLGDMTAEEVSDLRRVLALAEYVLEKHQDKEQLRDVLRELVGAMDSSILSIRGLDSEIAELAATAESHLARLREAQASMTGSAQHDADV